MLPTVFNANDSIICFPKKKSHKFVLQRKVLSHMEHSISTAVLSGYLDKFLIYIYIFLSEYPEKIAFKVTFRKNVSEITFAPGTTCSRLLKVQFVIFKVYFKAAVCNIKNCFRGTVCNVYRGFKEAGSYD